MQCVVCVSPTRPGRASWHARCPTCSYECAALKPTINVRQAHAMVNERDREIALMGLRGENFKTIVEHASRNAVPASATLLDVGSAHGWFLEQASDRFHVLGIEPDQAVGEKAAARGLPVRHGYFPDALEEGERFDVIVFNDVIEHIPDIRSALTACHTRLNPHGILILNLPNSRGFFYQLSKLFAAVGWSGPFERMWQKDLPSPHVHYFDERNLTALVSRYGFAKLDSFELPALRANGLLERLRFVGKVNPFALYAQYAAIMCAIPLLKLFPSDIGVAIYRKA